MSRMGCMKRFAKGLNPLSNEGKEYWQQEYHWHKQVESEASNTEKCGFSWCDVYDMTPWKAQCSYEGTGQCGAQAEYSVRAMDKTRVAKMDMETFRQLKDAEDERDYWRRLARELIDIIKKVTKKGSL